MHSQFSTIVVAAKHRRREYGTVHKSAFSSAAAQGQSTLNRYVYIDYHSLFRNFSVVVSLLSWWYAVPSSKYVSDAIYGPSAVVIVSALSYRPIWTRGLHVDVCVVLFQSARSPIRDVSLLRCASAALLCCSSSKSAL
jgi:hypothetical protein